MTTTTGRPTVSWDFEAIGTQWRIDTAEPLSAEQRAAVVARIDRYDADYSRFRADSLVSRLRTEPGRHAFPEDAVALFDVYDRLAEATSGRVDPFVGESLERLGYDAAYSFVADRGADLGAASRGARWSDARVDAGVAEVVTTSPAVLDLGAAGKGHLVDLVCEVLVGLGVEGLTVDASGDLRSVERPEIIALEHPFDPARAIGIAKPGDRALCASATSRRSWGEGLHHVLDGLTGRPVDSIAATWVVADSALEADGLATALFVADPESLRPAFAFDYVRMFTDGRAQYSPTFPGELFS